MNARMSTGAGLVDLYHGPDVSVETAGGLEQIAPLRPEGESWILTVGAMMRTEQRDFRAPRHIATGARWWPPEATAAGANIVAQHDGSWKVILTSLYADFASETQPPDSPIPPIVMLVPLKAGGTNSIPMTPDANIAVSRTWHGFGGFNTVITLSAGWVGFLSGGLDFTKPVAFGVDGDPPWGPTQFSAYMPQPHAHPVHAPAKPVGVRITSTVHTHTLTWTATPGVGSWQITRGGHVIATVTSPHFTERGLHPGVTHHYGVIAVGPGGSSPPTTITGTTKPAPVDTRPKTATVRAMWDAAYDGNHSRRSDHPSNPWQSELVTGRFDSTHGNTHSVVRFDLSGIPKGATITSVRLTMYALHWFSFSGGTAVIRNIHLGGHALNRHTPESSGHTTDMTWGGRPWAAKTVSIADTAAQRAAWGSGAVNAIQIGLSHTTGQAGYGVFDGTGSRRPTIEIKYHL